MSQTPRPFRTLLARHARVLGWLCATTFLFTLGVTSRHSTWGDARQSWAFAKAVVDRGSVDIDHEFGLYQAPDGRKYSRFPLLQVGQAVPALLLARAAETLGAPRSLRMVAATSVLAGWTALLACALYLLLVVLGARPRRAVPVTLVVIAASPIVVYSRFFYGEICQTALFVCWTLSWLWVRRRPSPAGLLLHGALIGLCVLAKSTFAVLLPWLVVDLWLQRRSDRRPVLDAAWVALGGAPFAALFFAYNFLRFGDPLAQNYDAGYDSGFGFDNPLLTGLFGMFLSPGKSVFLYAPLVLVSFLGLRARLVRAPAHAAVLLGPSLVLTLLVAKWWGWGGDWSWGPRLLIPTIPLLSIAGLPIFGPAPIPRRVWLAGAAGLAVNALGVLIHPIVYNQIVHTMHRGIFHAPGPWAFVRDDLSFLHFDPMFSPLKGHLWLLRANLLGIPLEQEMPWKDAGVEMWTLPSDVRTPRLDLWFTGAPDDTIALLVLAGVLSLCALKLADAVKTAPGADAA